MILGELPERYVLYDFDTHLFFDVPNPLGEVTVVPPPPGSSYQFAVLGALVAKMGYRARVLNMSTCRRATIARILSNARGELLYVGYAHRLAYAGPGAVVNQEELSPESVKRVARGNVKYRVMWQRCLSGETHQREVVSLGRLPEALGMIEIWLAERLGRR